MEKIVFTHELGHSKLHEKINAIFTEVHAFQQIKRKLKQTGLRWIFLCQMNKYMKILA